jgi:hypothetical protein
MEKNILNEINRNREIMGLGLLKEAWNLNSSVVWTDFLQKYKPELFDNVETVQPAMNDSGEYSFKGFASKFKMPVKKHPVLKGRFDEIHSNWKMMAFALGSQFLMSDDGLEEDVVLFPLTEKDIKNGGGPRKGFNVGLPGVNLNGEKLSVHHFVWRINQFNLENFGERQITSWSYNKGDQETEVNKEAVTDELYLFSTKRVDKSSSVVTTKGTPGDEYVQAAEGRPIPGGSAFAVLEVIPNGDKVKELLSAIQGAADEGMSVTNVTINGVASEQVIANTGTWKANVGNEYSNMSDADITKNITGKFTEPITGNQVLAYLRAQNLGKELEKVGITVDGYSYSVGGDEMKADVIIKTQKPEKKATKGTPDTKSQEFTKDTTDLTGQGKILGMMISMPSSLKYWKEKFSGISKKEAEDVLTSNKASGY